MTTQNIEKAWLEACSKMQETSSEDANSDDKRNQQRRRVLKGVRIAFGNDHCAVEGVLKNISDIGALIELKDGNLVPDTIVLHNELEGYKVPCRVVRRELTRIGVEFSAEKEAIRTTKSQVVNMINLDQSASGQNNVEQNNEPLVKTSIAIAARKKPVFGKLGNS